MVALRHPYDSDEEIDESGTFEIPDADWLPLQQAACELGISISTARRRIRRGELRNRIVPRRGSFAYLIYVPNSRHANLLGDHTCGPAPRSPREPIDLQEYLRTRNSRDVPAYAPPLTEARGKDLQIRRLEEQVEHLSEALSRALRVKQKALPPGMGEPAQNIEDPYARYRWLVRKKRWWPF